MFILFAFVVRIYRLVVGVTFEIVMRKLEQVLVGIHVNIYFVINPTISDINNGIFN